MSAFPQELDERHSVWCARVTATALLLLLVAPVIASSEPNGGIPIDALRGQPVAALGPDAPAIEWTARVLRPADVRRAPRTNAAVRFRTDGYSWYSGVPAVLLVTGASREVSGHEWVRVLLAVRPNGASGWMQRKDVRLIVAPLRIRVHLATRTLELWRGKTRLSRYPVGIGTPQAPTPVGRFAIDDKVLTRRSDRPSYGPYILTVTAYSNVLLRFNGGDGQIAIHGMGAAGRVGVAASHGCLVLAPAALESIWRSVARGTPIEVTLN
jgi:lipoprotein-anchoring transpeptidase ErfK/SrfK